MIKGIKFVNIPVADQSRALAFYTEKLGFTVATNQPMGPGGQRWIELKIPGADTRVSLFTPRARIASARSFRSRSGPTTWRGPTRRSARGEWSSLRRRSGSRGDLRHFPRLGGEPAAPGLGVEHGRSTRRLSRQRGVPSAPLRAAHTGEECQVAPADQAKSPNHSEAMQGGTIAASADRMTKLTRTLLVLVPVTVFAGGLASVACTSTTDTPGGGSSSGSSSGGSSSGASSSGGSSSGGSSSGASSSGGWSSGESSSGGGPDCGRFEQFPPIVVVSSSTGLPFTCNATFQVLDLPDASIVPVNGDAVLCPPPGADAATAPTGCFAADAGASFACTYVLEGLTLANGPFSLQVSEPGFVSATITKVAPGEGGCVPYTAPTTSDVTLDAVPEDAGADAADGS